MALQAAVRHQLRHPVHQLLRQPRLHLRLHQLPLHLLLSTPTPMWLLRQPLPPPWHPLYLLLLRQRLRQRRLHQLTIAARSSKLSTRLSMCGLPFGTSADTSASSGTRTERSVAFLFVVHIRAGLRFFGIQLRWALKLGCFQKDVSCAYISKEIPLALGHCEKGAGTMKSMVRSVCQSIHGGSKGL